jgi:hypothetical protein
MGIITDFSNDDSTKFIHMYTCMHLYIVPFVSIHMYITIQLIESITSSVLRLTKRPSNLAADYKYMYIYMYIYVYIYVYIHKHIYICMYIYVYLHIYMYMYLHRLTKRPSNLAADNRAATASTVFASQTITRSRRSLSTSGSGSKSMVYMYTYIYINLYVYICI